MIKTVPNPIFYLFFNTSSKMTKKIFVKFVTNKTKHQNMPLTHFIMIFRKFKWPNTQIHRY